MEGEEGEEEKRKGEGNSRGEAREAEL